MQAILSTQHGPQNVYLRAIDDPPAELKSDEVVIKVSSVGVCGSDIHVYHGTESFAMDYPVVLGHEMCGIVERVASQVTDFFVGDRVVSETAFRVCGACLNCREGRYNLCSQRRGFGAAVNGGMAERVLTRAAILHHVPDGVSDVSAALTEPTCVAYQAVVVNAGIQPGDVVAIIGPGPIGLMALQVTKLVCPSYIAMVGTPRDGSRLALAREWGADAVFDNVDTARDGLRSVGWADGVDVVIDAAGVAATVQLALDIVRPGGCITKIGWDSHPLNLSLDPLVAKAVRLQGSFSHTWSTWERVLRLLGRHSLRPELMAETFPLANWEQAFQRMGSQVIAKAVLTL